MFTETDWEKWEMDLRHLGRMLFSKVEPQEHKKFVAKKIELDDNAQVIVKGTMWEKDDTFYECRFIINAGPSYMSVKTDPAWPIMYWQNYYDMKELFAFIDKNFIDVLLSRK